MAARSGPPMLSLLLVMGHSKAAACNPICPGEHSTIVAAVNNLADRTPTCLTNGIGFGSP